MTTSIVSNDVLTQLSTLYLELDQKFLEEVSEFAKLIFRSSFVLDETASGDTLKLNFGSLAMANTSVSIQLLLRVIRDETGQYQHHSCRV